LSKSCQKVLKGLKKVVKKVGKKLAKSDKNSETGRRRKRRRKRFVAPRPGTTLSHLVKISFNVPYIYLDRHVDVRQFQVCHRPEAVAEGLETRI
jgi:hypothetical protein